MRRILVTGVAIGLIVVGGLLLALVDFRAALVLAGGLGAALIITWLLSRLLADASLLMRLGLSAMLVVLLAGGIAAGLALTDVVTEAGFGDGDTGFILLDPQDADDEPGGGLGTDSAADETIIRVNALRLIVTPADPNLNAFTVEPLMTVGIYNGFEVLQGEERITLPPVEVTQETMGFLVREVSLGSYDRSFDITVSGQPTSLNPCAAGCPQTVVELRDMPTGTFHDARYATNLQAEEYVNTETIIWEVTRQTRPIVFAFVQPPFNAVSGILTPILGASTLNDWVIGVVALVGGVAVLPVVQAFVQSWAEDKVVDAVRGDRRRSRRRSSRRGNKK